MLLSRFILVADFHFSRIEIMQLFLRASHVGFSCLYSTQEITFLYNCVQSCVLTLFPHYMQLLRTRMKHLLYVHVHTLHIFLNLTSLSCSLICYTYRNVVVNVVCCNLCPTAELKDSFFK